VRGGSVPCSAVSCSSRLVTASNMTFFSGAGCGGGDRRASSIAFAFSRTAALPGFSAFSGPSAPAFGVIPEDVRTSQLVATDSREGSADATVQTQTRACPERQERHRGPPRRLYMRRSWRVRRQTCRARHRGYRGQRLPPERCPHLDRDIERGRCAHG
jgi:hypothetical protein